MSGGIGIVGGTGPTGLGLGLRWARAGEQVIIGSRDARRARAAAQEIAARAGKAARVEGCENASAVKRSRVVVLTVPFTGHAELLKELRPAFQPGAVLIDATVPLAAAVGGRPTRTLGLWQGSAAQQAAELVPEGVAVAAAFQNISQKLLNGDEPIDCDVIVCSDHAEALETACRLAEKIPGVRAVNGGKLENARVLEQITALLITINLQHKVPHCGLRITGLHPNK